MWLKIREHYTITAEREPLTGIRLREGPGVSV